MSHRSWFFRIIHLSLSLLFTPFPVSSGDVGTMGKFVIQALQVAGFGAAAFFNAGEKITGSPNVITNSTTSKSYGIPKIGRPVVNTAEQGGKGTASVKKTSHKENESGYVLSCWNEEIKKYDNAALDKAITQAEAIVKNAEGSKGFYKGEALKDTEDHIAFYTAHIDQLKAEKVSRLSQQVTTTAASTAVLITQTAPTTMSTEPLAKDGEKPPYHRRNDGADSKKDMNDNEPPHETGKELNFSDKPNQGLGAHPWRDKIGHYATKNIENMKEVQNAVTKGTFRGVIDGKFQYDWTCPETGKQVWVETIGNKVQNCGFNAPGEHWVVGKSGFLIHPSRAEAVASGLIKGVTAVGGSVAFNSDFLAQTQEDAQLKAREAAIEQRFDDIVDPYGISKLSNNTTSNLLKSNSDGRIDYNDVTEKLVKNFEPRTSEVQKIMNHAIIKSSVKIDGPSITKATSSKTKHVSTPKFISERHKKAYINAHRPKWAHSKKD